MVQAVPQASVTQAKKGTTTESVTVPYQSYINQASSTYNVPAGLIEAVIKQESGYNATATSSAGAEGLMQLMPSTAAGLGVTNPYNAHQNIMGGTKYLSQLINQFNGDFSLALAAYNAGPQAVKNAGDTIPQNGQTPNYVSSILANYNGGKVGPTGSVAIQSGSSANGPTGNLLTNFSGYMQAFLGTAAGICLVLLGIWVALNPFSDLTSAISNSINQFAKIPLEGATKAVKNAPNAVRNRNKKQQENKNITPMKRVSNTGKSGNPGKLNMKYVR